MIDAGIKNLLRYFFGAYPLRSVLLVCLLALAGLAEGVGVATLVPMLETIEPGGAQSTVGRRVSGTFQALGIEPTLGMFLLLIVLMISVKALFRWFAMRQVGFTMARVGRDLRLKFIRALLEAQWTYFGGRRTGILGNTLNAEVVAATQAYRQACEILAAVFPIMAYLIFATMVSWEVSVGAIISGGGLIFVLRRFIRSAQVASRRQVASAKSLSGQIVDIVQGLKPIRAMAREELVLPILERDTFELNRAQVKGISARENLRVFQEPALTLLLAGAIYVLAVGLGQPLSSLIVLAFVFYRLLTHVNQLQSQYQMVVTGESSYASLMQQIKEAEDLKEVQWGGEEAPQRLESISLERVSFSYGDGYVLKGLDMTVRAGEFVAIIGESGAGKTTLIDLIVGLLKPDDGQILVNGRNLQQMDLRSWRREIGYVPQEMLLLNDSIERNITFGDPDVTADDVRRALRMSGAWHFVERLPSGVSTIVGEKGSKLSGGQRQRIAIARALVTKPSLLVLDEVTTALDPDTEAGICRTLNGLAGQVTILAISHQPAIRNAAGKAYRLVHRRLVSEPSPDNSAPARARS